MTPAQFARAIWMPRQLVYNWSEGTCLPTQRNRDRIFRFFKSGHNSIEDIMNDDSYKDYDEE